MAPPRILTIGHSNHPIERFLALLSEAGVELVADVRSFPSSRHAPQFNRPALARALAQAGIDYLYCGNELGGRAGERTEPASPADFERGLDRVTRESGVRRVALMCAERDPLDCHRLALARILTERGVDVGHVLATGEIAGQAAVDERLLKRKGLADDDLFSREERLTDAYRARRARARAG
jgi:uncharacterized protein (DUF488 family)